MTALVDSEIEVGLVGWLDQAALNKDERVIKTTPYLGDPEPRPFLCFRIKGGTSFWAPTTTVWRRERLELKDSWRTGGGPGWRSRANYLVDGANTYVGPASVFVEASSLEWTEPGSRMRLSPAGLAAVEAEVEKQKPRMLRPPPEAG